MKLQITGGSVPGREHLYVGGGLVGYNNHDSIIWDWWSADSGIALVADGVGGDLDKEMSARAPFSVPRRRRSEVGSNAAVLQLLKHCTNYRTQLQQQLREAMIGNMRLPYELPVLKRIREDYLAEVRVLANIFRCPHHSFTDIIQRYFLCPVQIAVVFPDVAAIFGTGDGVNAINGDIVVLPTEGANNTPAALGYNLVDAADFNNNTEPLQLRLRRVCDSQNFGSILIGTDGAEEIDEVAESLLPGGDQKAGPLSQFWIDPVYSNNRMRIQGKLNLFQGSSAHIASTNDNAPRLVREEPLLIDDTTVALMKLVPQS